jgi:hypothetical protein
MKSLKVEMMNGMILRQGLQKMKARTFSKI